MNPTYDAIIVTVDAVQQIRDLIYRVADTDGISDEAACRLLIVATMANSLCWDLHALARQAALCGMRAESQAELARLRQTASIKS